MGIYRNHSRVRHSIPLLAGILAGAMVLLSGCYDVAFSACEELPAEGIESLRVISTRGSVELVGVSEIDTLDLGGAIHVHAASEKSAERKAQMIDLQMYADGSEAVVELWIPPSAGSAWGELVLTVPEELAGRVETTDGRISISGMRASQEVRTTNAQIEATDVIGDLGLATTNGKIVLSEIEGTVEAGTTNGAVEAEELDGELALVSSNGKMVLHGGSGVADLWTTNGSVEVQDWEGDLLVRTDNGRVDLEGVTGAAEAITTNGAIEAWDHRGDLDLNTTNGRIEMEVVIPDGGTVLAHTTNGPVDLHVPPDTAGSLVATTTNGHIDIEDLAFDGTMTHDEAIGHLGCGGTVEIVLATTNGSIEIDGEDDLGGDCDDAPEDADGNPEDGDCD